MSFSLLIAPLMRYAAPAVLLRHAMTMPPLSSSAELARRAWFERLR